MQPDTNAVVVAYYQSAVTIEYLVQTYGFPKIVEALKLFGKGKETPEVLQAITGKTIAQLDADFRAVPRHPAQARTPARSSCRPAASTTSPSSRSPPTPRPRTRKARAHVALGYYYARRGRQGRRPPAQAALALDAEAADRALHPGRGRAARGRRGQGQGSSTPALIADGYDNYDLRARLAQIAAGREQADEVEQQLCAAKKLDPERSYPYQELAQLYEKQGDMPKALVELEHYAFLEQMELAPLKKLDRRVRQARQLGQGPHLRRDGDVHRPPDPDILPALGERVPRDSATATRRSTPTTRCCSPTRRRAGPRWSTSAAPGRCSRSARRPTPRPRSRRR